jgi:phosphatidylglycerol:prolipoprotein diacylglycerol transferase
MALGFLVGYWITVRRMIEEGLDPKEAPNILMWIMIGGVGGSKLYFAIDVSLREGRAFFPLLFARDGITWYGGLIMATAVGAFGCRRHGVPVKTFADCTAVAGAVGQSIGRVGCFLVGDDYGRTTDAAWGVTFPNGIQPVYDPVHQTQLYEIAWLMPVAAFLWWRRHKSPFLFGEYIALNGLGRVIIENWRVNEPILGFTEPQWIGAGLIVLGAAGWIYYYRSSEPDGA